jgi:hypothetical protein
VSYKKSSYVILQEHERESRLGQSGPWGMLLTHLPQIAVAERSYGELGFLITKNKGFLRKDVGQMCVCVCVCARARGHVFAYRMSKNVHMPLKWVLKVIFGVQMPFTTLLKTLYCDM